MAVLGTTRRHPVGDGGALLDSTLVTLFEAMVDEAPDSPAVTFDDCHLSRRELNRRANRLAHRLRRLGVGPDARVALHLERSPGLVAAVLGVLKAGGAYVPLEPEYPRERLDHMLADSGARVLLTRRPGELSAPPGCPVLTLDELAGEPDADPPGGAGPGNLAYVIYTSGSIGRPKGVMITHAAIRSRVLWLRDEYRLGPDDAVLMKTAFSFDASVWEILLPPVSGARLVVARPGGHRDGRYLAGVIEGQ